MLVSEIQSISSSKIHESPTQAFGDDDWVDCCSHVYLICLQDLIRSQANILPANNLIIHK